jgi:hypothetical protein
MQRLLSHCIVFIVFLTCISCQEPEEKRELLRVTIESGYFGPGNISNAKWMLLTDAHGNTLDYKEIKGNETELIFVGHPAQDLSLTTLHYNFFENQGPANRKQFLVSTIMGLSSGQIIALELPDARPPQTPIPDAIDQLSFTLTNYSDSKNPAGSFHFSDGFFCCYSTLLYPTIDYQPPVFQSKILLRQNPGSILVVSYRDGLPVHKWVQDIKPGDNVTVDFASFEVSKLIPVNKPIVNGSVRSIVGGDYAGDISRGHILSSIENRMNSLSSAASATYQLGYLDGFDTYFTAVEEKHLCCEGPSVSYRKLGTIPKSINLPDNSFQLVTPEMDRFAYVFTNEYTEKEVFFESASLPELGITWSIRAPMGVSLAVPKLPGQVLQLYPELKTSNLKLSHIRFSKELDGYSYQQILADVFAYRFRAIYETLSYTYRPAR